MGIEKLGITKGPWEVGHDNSVWSGKTFISDQFNKNRDSNTNLIAAAPEMLEALITYCRWFSDFMAQYGDRINDWEVMMNTMSKEIILKACPGKTWEQIKAAYDE